MTDSRGLGDEQALSRHERADLMRDGIFNGLNLVASAAVGIVLVPVMLRGLGAASYGLWIIALSLPGLVGAVDFGLGLSVTQQVSSGNDAGARRRAARFVMAAGNAHATMGLVGMVVIGSLGFLPGNVFHLSSPDLREMPGVVGLIGVSHLCERIGAFEGEVLWGLKRFGIMNTISIAATVMECAGIMGILLAGGGLIHVAAWHTAVAAGAAIASFAAVARLEPAYRFRIGRIEWRTIRPNIPFSLSTQVAEAARNLLWQMPPLVIGSALGSASVVPYHIGRRIPQMINMLYMRASAVFFPAVSERATTANRAGIREILEVGTRWIVVWTLPLCVGLWIVAPKLLHAWIGFVPPGSVAVLRVLTVSVFVEAVAAASIQSLWALRAIRTILVIPTVVLLASVGLIAVLLPRLGIVGAGWGLSVPMSIGAVAFFQVASRACGTRIGSVLAAVSAGLSLPVLVLLAVTFSISHFSGQGWIGVIGTTVGGGFGYLGAFWFVGARAEEMLLVRRGLAASATAGRSVYEVVRHLLGRAR